MFRYLSVLFLIVTLLGGILFAWGYYTLESQHRYYDEADVLEAAGKLDAARAMSRQGHAERDRGGVYIGISMIVAGVGAAGLVLSLLIGFIVSRPKGRNAEEAIAALTTPDKLRPGERLLNTAVVLRQPYSPGDRDHVSEKVLKLMQTVRPRWQTFAVALTNERIFFLPLAAMRFGFRFGNQWQEEYEIKDVVDCTTASHWKGNDVILHFPRANPMLLRLYVGRKDTPGQDAFWQEVPRRFGRPPIA